MYTEKDIRCVSNFFTDNEVDQFCEKQNVFSEDNWEDSTIINSTEHEGKYDPAVRKAKVKYLYPTSTDPFLMKFVFGVIEANHTKFKKDSISPLRESLNLLKYTNNSSLFKMHIDSGSSSISARQLSCIVILSKIADYEGGGLVFYGNERGAGRFRLHTEKGSLIVFPSDMFHEVTPITKGTRLSLIMWV